jgi:hypothetical protein
MTAAVGECGRHPTELELQRIDQPRVMVQVIQKTPHLTPSLYVTTALAHVQTIRTDVRCRNLGC